MTNLRDIQVLFDFPNLIGEIQALARGNASNVTVTG